MSAFMCSERHLSALVNAADLHRYPLSCRELMLHEVAHIIEPGGHHDAWRAVLILIGGTIDPVPGILRSYRKKRRS